MAAAETARLLASLELQDKFTPTLKNIDRRLGAFSGAVNRNLGRALDAGLQRGVRAIGDAIGGGIEALASLEDATTSVDGAIKQLGLTGQLTGSQVATWANEIETNVGAAFDDKAITSATATLIRFGKVTPGNIRPAMEVMTDLAAKTGDVDSAASLLAKALADPEKAAGKLARSGVVLTKEQQKQIKAMVAAGDAAGAQAFLLEELAKTTEGAAAASQGPYRRSLNLLADASEDAKKALAEGFLPVIERVRSKLTAFLADPKNIEHIRTIGKNLADAFDKAVAFLEGVDWKSIGSGLKIAADWASKLFDAFMAIPPEGKALILGLAGLNKLSGGAVGGIVGELGKGLIKGVLGMTAGVVNLNAGVVKGAGALPSSGTGGAVAGAAKGGLGIAGKMFLVGEAIGLVAAVEQVRGAISDGNSQFATEISDQTASFLAANPDPTAIRNALAGVDQGIADLKSNPLNVLVQGDALTKLESMRESLKTALGTMSSAEDHAGKKADDTIASVKEAKSAQVAALRETRVAIAEKVAAGATTTAAAARNAGDRMVAGTAGIAAAVRSSRPIVNVKVDVGVAATNVVKKYTTIRRYGPTGGSRDGRGASGPTERDY